MKSITANLTGALLPGVGLPTILLSSLLLTSPLLTRGSAAQDDAAAAAPAETYKVQQEGQPLFKKPNQCLGLEGRLPLGTELSVLESKGPWMQVQGESLSGWIQGTHKQLLSGPPVDAEYLRSRASAKIGSGLVTKGFSKTYAKSHEVSDEQAAEVDQQLQSARFEYEAYEAFVGAHGLRPAEADDEPASEPAPAAKPGPGGRENPFGPAKLGGGLSDDLTRAREQNKLRMQITRDEHFFSRNMSYEEEECMGYGVAQRLAAGRIFHDETLDEYINLIGAALVAHSDRLDIPYVFTVLESDEINAFAAPGGYIFITTACIRACKDEAELACVLGHEVAHVARRHGLRTLDQNRVRIASKMLGSEMDRVLEKYYGPRDPEQMELIKKLQSLADDSYKSCTEGWNHEFELEADEFGMRYAGATGWDYRGMLRFLKVLAGEEHPALGKAWGSHPPASERIDRLRALVQSQGWMPSDNRRTEVFEQKTQVLR